MTINPGWRTNLLRALALVLVIGITFSLFALRGRFSHLNIVGYPVMFLLSILLNATVFLPLPSIALASVLGANTVFNPILVAVVVGSGAAFGEITGYLAGFGGQIVLENVKWYERFLKWMKRYGGWAILVLAFIPNPLFDLAGISAGALKMPLAKFLFWCCLGKILKMLVFSLAGAGFIKLFPWMASWIN
jgi:membrane protein DedA with SNARE-associated domain